MEQIKRRNERIRIDPSAAPMPADASPRADLEFTEAISAIVDAFGDPTRRSIYLFVRDGDGVSATEVATHFLLHPNVARHHLDKLVAGGYLDYGVERSTSAGAGRPSKRYRSSNKASLFDREKKQFELMSMLLSRTLELLPLDLAGKMAEEVGEAYGRSLASQIPTTVHATDLRSVMAAIAEALSAHGFSTPQEIRKHHYKVINYSCPFGITAIEHPVLCAVDRGIIKGMLSALYPTDMPITLRSKARGDIDCSVAI